MTAIDTTTNVDIALLVGEQEELACEHPNHGDDPTQHADGGETYIRILTPCGCNETDVHVACGKWLAGARREGEMFYCPNGHSYPCVEVIQVLGPVKSFQGAS